MVMPKVICIIIIIVINALSWLSINGATPPQKDPKKTGPLLSAFSNLFKTDKDKKSTTKTPLPIPIDKKKLPAKKLPVAKAKIIKRDSSNIAATNKKNTSSSTIDNKNRTGYGMYNPNIFQGDILGFDRNNITQYLKEQELAVKNRKNSSFLRNAVYARMLWPNGRIPYVIDRSFNRDYYNDIMKAFAEYARVTCIKFVPRSNNDNDYIYIEQSRGNCFAYIGHQGGQQMVYLSPYNCDFGTILHELMHAVGFYHEQARPDRDQYVTINYQNIQPNQVFNFDKQPYSMVRTLGLKYDYGSIMHYRHDAFAINGRQTIVPHKNVEIGQTVGFSKLDIQKINKLYECTKTGGETSVNEGDDDDDNNDKNGNTNEIDERTNVNADNGKWNIKTINTRKQHDCSDQHPKCSMWAKNGECRLNPSWMLPKCQKSCRMC